MVMFVSCVACGRVLLSEIVCVCFQILKLEKICVELRLKASKTDRPFISIHDDLIFQQDSGSRKLNEQIAFLSRSE